MDPLVAIGYFPKIDMRLELAIIQQSRLVQSCRIEVGWNAGGVEGGGGLGGIAWGEGGDGRDECSHISTGGASRSSAMLVTSKLMTHIFDFPKIWVTTLFSQKI